jgi:hypothetical protein
VQGLTDYRDNAVIIQTYTGPQYTKMQGVVEGKNPLDYLYRRLQNRHNTRLPGLPAAQLSFSKPVASPL